MGGSSLPPIKRAHAYIKCPKCGFDMTVSFNKDLGLSRKPCPKCDTLMVTEGTI